LTRGGVRGTRSVTLESTRGEANAEERAETTSVVWARRAQTGGGEGGGGQKDGETRTECRARGALAERERVGIRSVGWWERRRRVDGAQARGAGTRARKRNAAR